jgi:hypothetical protein
VNVPPTTSPTTTRLENRMWHVTLTVAGDPVPQDDVRVGLEQLAHERPFLLTGRYATDRAEVRYWEEADCLEDAAALALRLWGEHRESAGLPPWRVTALEVLEQTVQERRNAEEPMGVMTIAAVHPAGAWRRI